MSASEASQQANRAEMDPKRLVVVAYLVFGIILTMFLGHIFALVLAQVGVTDTKLIDTWAVSDVLGLIVTAGLGAWSWTNPKSHQVSMEVASELMRVTWPTWEETRVSTFAVVAASIIAGVLLFFIDSFSYKLMVDWLPHMWGKL